MVHRPQNYKGLYGILQLSKGSHLDNFLLKTLKLGWVAFHPLPFQLKCLYFQSNRNKKLTPVLSRFCKRLLFDSSIHLTRKPRVSPIASFVHEGFRPDQYSFCPDLDLYESLIRLELFRLKLFRQDSIPLFSICKSVFVIWNPYS